MRGWVLLIIPFLIGSCGGKAIEGPENPGAIKGVVVDGTTAHGEKVRVEACLSSSLSGPVAYADVSLGDGFIFHIPRGVYDIWAIGPGKLKGRISNVEVSEGEVVDVGQIRLKMTWPVRGRFLTGFDESGRVLVMGSSIEVEPGERGRFEIWLPEGEYTIVFSAEGVGEEGMSVVVKEGEEVEIDKDVRMGRLIVLTGWWNIRPGNPKYRFQMLDLDTGQERPLDFTYAWASPIALHPFETKVAISTNWSILSYSVGGCLNGLSNEVSFVSSSGIWVYDFISGEKRPVYRGEGELVIGWREEWGKSVCSRTPPPSFPESGLFKPIDKRGYKLIYSAPLSWSWDGKWIICLLAFYNASEEREIGGIAAVRSDIPGSGAYWIGSFQYDLVRGYGFYRGETYEEALRRREFGPFPPFHPLYLVDWDVVPRLSYDGRKLITPLEQPRERGKPYRRAVYLEEERQEPKEMPLVDPLTGHWFMFIWTPDGRICVTKPKFLTIRGCSGVVYRGVYIMNPDGGGEVALTDPDFGDVRLLWISPDGRWVYVARWVPAIGPIGCPFPDDLERVEIWAIKADGSKVMRKKWSITKEQGIGWDNYPVIMGMSYVRE